MSATTSTPSPSATNDDEAAITAVRRFYTAFDDALRTRKSDEFRKTFLPGCRVCAADAAVIEQAQASGRTFQTAGVSIGEMKIIGKPDPTRRLLVASVTSARLVILDATGKVVEENPAASQQKNLSVYLKEGQWLVESVAG